MILGFFLLNRDRTSGASRAAWIPAAWLGIGASRSVSDWLAGGSATVMTSPDEYLSGSPLDALVFAGLELAAAGILMTRRTRTRTFLRANGPLLLFFVYCLVSVMWSDYPFVAVKRWTKAVGNLLMVLVLLTEDDPAKAVRSALLRAGLVLIPISVLLIKYYPELGRGFDAWTGRAYNSGAGIDKNGLGIICLVFGLGFLWDVVRRFQRDQNDKLRRRLVAQSTVLAMTLWLFSMADSATSFGCFLAGGALIVLTSWRPFRKSLVMHSVVLGIVVVCVVGVMVDANLGLVQAVGRDPTLTTRTDLWAALLQIPVNPLVGTGFESFWLGERCQALWETYWWHPNQAHNGYLEVYLNLGWLGLFLLGFVIVQGYRNVAVAVQREPELGRLQAAFFVAALLYNLTEAAFKVVHPVWVMFLLAVSVRPRFRPSVMPLPAVCVTGTPAIWAETRSPLSEHKPPWPPVVRNE
jgi:O-antigen ligase